MGKGNGVRYRSDDADSVRGSCWAARHALSMLAGRTTDLALGVFVGGILAYVIVVTARWWNLHGLLLLPASVVRLAWRPSVPSVASSWQSSSRPWRCSPPESLY